MITEQAPTFLHDLENRIAPLRARLAKHPLYASIQTLEALHLFMEAHVFAVWDFMSLLKALQRGLTCVDLPWFPTEYAEARRLINEIVLGEESDVYEGRALSHFELYLQAMRTCGASTQAMEHVLNALHAGSDIKGALTQAGAPKEAQAFVEGTFALIHDAISRDAPSHDAVSDQRKLHIVAAAFTFGREDLIPEMFRGFVRDLDRELAGRLEVLVWYLERHIEVDGEEHGPMALRMVSSLCGNDARLWKEAADAAEAALLARIALWDSILQRIAKSGC